MRPMLAGLQPFLGKASLGTFESVDKSSRKWVAGDGVGVKPPTALARLEQAWIAVLTGRFTRSSGEAVAFAFRGRPRTRSFGVPTGGLSTSPNRYSLPDGAALSLATELFADRTGRRYGRKVDPDERVEGDATAGNDPVLAAAVRWLKQSSGCAK
jgi:C-terminal processing protease CtpA/Prc